MIRVAMSASGAFLSLGLVLAGSAPVRAQAQEDEAQVAPQDSAPANGASGGSEAAPAEAVTPPGAAEPGEDAGGGEEFSLKLSGRVQTDIRARIQDKSVGEFYDRRPLPIGIERNENVLGLKLHGSYGRIDMVADVDFAWLGYPVELPGIPALSDITRTDPYYLQVRGLYLEAQDLLPGLDLRVGQQTVLWGKGDQFNPTNNLNPNDLEDVLLFGEQLANTMVKVDYTPYSDFTLSGVLVPIFKPALIPRSAPLALSSLDRMPMLDEVLRRRLAFEQSFARTNGYATVASSIRPQLPERSFDNMPFAFRLALPVLEQDFAISYYRGFSDMPAPVRNHTRQVQQAQCDPAIPDDPATPQDERVCLSGLLETETTLAFPRMQVLGFNLAGEVNPLGWISESIQPIGYRIELAVVLPGRTEMVLDQDEINLGITQPAGEYDYFRGGARPLVVDDTPFLKWVVGLDYSFSEHLYLNLMWVHGLPDEFGAGDFLHPGKSLVVRQGRVKEGDNSGYVTCAATAFLTGQSIGPCGERYGRERAVEILRPRIGDYAVLILDFKFNDDRGLVRLMGMWDLSGYFEDFFDEGRQTRVRRYLSLFGDGFSAVVYPEFNYNFGRGLDLGAGALFQLGKSYTKFGDPAAGGSLVWTRARFRF